VSVRILKANLDKVLLAFIFVALSGSTLAWTLKDRTPPAWDPSDHISAGYDYYRTLHQMDFRAFAHEFFVKPHYYAPFVHLVTAGVFLFLGASVPTGIAVNILSLAALLVSTAWICRELYAEPRPDSSAQSGEALFLPSILAALLASCYHFSAWLLHDAFLDYPLMALVAVSFALLIRAGDFSDRRKAVAFGIAAGIGMLTKQTFPFFFALPALYVAVRILSGRSLRAVANLSLAAFTAAAISAVWYYPHLQDVLAIYGVNSEAAINENEAPLFSFMSNMFYPHALLSYQIQLPFAVLFILGLAYSIARRAGRSLILYLWLLSGLGVFTLIANKDVRYSVPVLPAAAILSVCWMGELSHLRKKKVPRAANRILAYAQPALGAFIAMWAIISFVNAQWPREGQGSYIDTPDFRWMVFARNYYGFDRRPLGDDWGVPEIVETVSRLGTGDSASSDSVRSLGDKREADAPGPKETVSPPAEAGGGPGQKPKPRLGVVVNLPHLNPSSVALYARLLAEERAGPPVITVLWIVSIDSRDRIESADYLLVRTGLDRAAWVSPMERFTEQFLNSYPERYVRVASFPIPLEQAEAVIYKRSGR
jgi:4-amino-4-deoxy-L-arabinose transferase-like glycosyltransferase